ncbi:MAG: hypothetical protein IPO10_14335 [Flavobacteriales bacterium]|nr:hypothetical protein [Flavobacteriales bacterium]
MEPNVELVTGPTQDIAGVTVTPLSGWAFSVLYSMGVQLNAVGIDNAPQGRSFGGGSGS